MFKGLQIINLLILLSSLGLIFSCLSKWNNFSPTTVDFAEYYPKDAVRNEEAFELGKQLFFDKRLSRDETVSCAVCHKPFLAFSDGLEYSDGVFDRKAIRNSPMILNMKYSPVFMFDANINTLEMQALSPLQDHNEMDMTMKEVLERIFNDSLYQVLAQKGFGRKLDPFVITRALGTYQRSIVATNSPFDQFYYGKDARAISASAKKGFDLFMNKFDCKSCHPLPMFTNYEALNNGLAIKNNDKGRFRSTGDSTDYGKFKVPSLRNIGLTAPYMHDGRFNSLQEVIQHYRKGGMNTINQDLRIKPLIISKSEEKNLIDFLESLQDLKFNIKI